MDKMRRTEHQRRVDIAEAELEAMIQVIALEELNRLFRGVQLKLRRINQYRPKAHPNHTRLTKADVTGTSLWDLFRGRLRSRLMEALLGGSISLYSLLTMRVADTPLTLDTDAIARELEYQVGERITQVTNTIKREVGRRIVAWYNSPGMPMQTIINQLRPAFGINRAELIASNEITELDSAVQFQIAAKLGIQKYWWGSKRDSLVCVKPITGPDGKIYNGCRELHGKVFDINMPMPPKGSHIKCRCKAHLILPKPTTPTETPIIDTSHLVKAEFVEGEHPRDKGGEFTGKGGEGSGGKVEKPVKVSIKKPKGLKIPSSSVAPSGRTIVGSLKYGMKTKSAEAGLTGHGFRYMGEKEYQLFIDGKWTYGGNPGSNEMERGIMFANAPGDFYYAGGKKRIFLIEVNVQGTGGGLEAPHKSVGLKNVVGAWMYNPETKIFENLIEIDSKKVAVVRKI
jgi:hypothetical protein